MSRRGLLRSPAFTGAVALLAVNDHLLKARFPGLVTGKLSDAAGVVVVAVALAVGTRRPTFAVVMTSALFAALKLIPTIASLAAPALGGVTRTDPTDLAALAVLVPIWRWLRRAPITATGTPARTGLRAVDAAVGVLAIFVCTATSCNEPHPINRVLVEGDSLWAGHVSTVTYGSSGQSSDTAVQDWAVSNDGGRTWRAAADQPEVGTAGSDEQCGRHGRCWRVVPAERVEVRDGADWVTDYEFSAEQWRRMDLRAGHDCGVAAARDGAFGQLVVTDHGGEEVVLVAMGSQGILRWSGGQWTRIGVLGHNPVSLNGPTWLAMLDRWSILALAASAPLVALAGVLWCRRKWERFVKAGLLTLVSAFVLTVLVAVTDWDYAVEGPVVAGLAIGVFLTSLLTALIGGRTAPEEAE